MKIPGVDQKEVKKKEMEKKLKQKKPPNDTSNNS